MKALLILLGVLVSLTASAQNWTRTAGPVEDDVLDLCIDSNGILYAVTPLGVNRSTDGGEHWTRPFVFPTPSSQNGIAIAANGNIIASSVFDLFVSTDGGISFKQTHEDVAANFALQFATTASGRIFAALEHTFFLSDDHGLTWKDVPRVGISWNKVTGVAASHDTVVVQLIEGLTGGAYRSVDNGNSWLPIEGEAPNAEYLQKLLYIDGALFAHYTYVWQYTSSIWKQIGLARFRQPANTADVFPGRVMLVSSVSGIFLYKNFETWYDVSSGFGRNSNGEYMPVTRFVKDARNDTYYAATLGAGVWKSASVLQSAGDDREQNRFSVSPNPFTNRTTIRFTAPTTSWTELELRNILGAVVWRQGREFCPPGANTLSIADHGLPPGSYLLVLHTNERTETQWVTIVK